MIGGDTPAQLAPNAAIADYLARRRCEHCIKLQTRSKICSRCRAVAYCSQECQNTGKCTS